MNPKTIQIRIRRCSARIFRSNDYNVSKMTDIQMEKTYSIRSISYLLFRRHTFLISRVFNVSTGELNIP